MGKHRFKQLRSKVVKNYTCISLTEDFDSVQRVQQNKISDEKN